MADKIVRWLQEAWQGLQREMQALRGAPFVAALIGVCALLLSLPQGADLVVTAATDRVQAVVLVVAALVYGFECWFWTRLIVERRARHAALAAETTPTAQPWQPGFTHRWAPRILGAAPFALAALAVFRAHVDNKKDAWILLVLAVVMLVGLRLRRKLFRQPKLADARPDHGWSRRTQYLSLVGAAAVALVYTLWPVGPAQTLGAISAAYLGVASVTAVMAALLNWGRVARLPILGALLLWAVLISPLTDANHAIGRRSFGAPQEVFAFRGKADLGEAFDAWCRQAGCKPGGPATPIVFVAAEGGASRAGYWAADVLGRLQSYPGLAGRFSDHVFAISAISGGSLGVVDYLAALHDNPDLPAPRFEAGVATASGYDYLSPVIAGLFPDMLQRLIPVTLLPDRAETLERGFEAGWRQHCRDIVPDPCRDHDLLTRPFLSLWSGGGGPWMPVLLIGGERQEDGRRVVTSNIWIEENDFPDTVDYHRLAGRDVGLSTAISNGARFPAASPGGVIENRWDAGRVTHMGHLLDGGYFDAGGANTMGDLAAAVMRRAAERHIALRPIFIEFSNNSDEPESAIELIRGRFSAAAQDQMSLSANDDWVTDVLGPFDGVFKARGSHGDTAAQTLALLSLYAKEGLPGAPTPGPYYLFHLCHGVGSVPMDWALSDPARAAADNALDHPYPGCDNAAKFRQLVADIAG